MSYAAADDAGQARAYSVCDHRLDGPPIRHAVQDHFGSRPGTELVAEVVLTDPRMSFDYVAFTRKHGRIGQFV